MLKIFIWKWIEASGSLEQWKNAFNSSTVWRWLVVMLNSSESLVWSKPWECELLFFFTFVWADKIIEHMHMMMNEFWHCLLKFVFRFQFYLKDACLFICPWVACFVLFSETLTERPKAFLLPNLFDNESPTCCLLLFFVCLFVLQGHVKIWHVQNLGCVGQSRNTCYKEVTNQVTLWCILFGVVLCPHTYST